MLEQKLVAYYIMTPTYRMNGADAAADTGCIQDTDVRRGLPVAIFVFSSTSRLVLEFLSSSPIPDRAYLPINRLR